MVMATHKITVEYYVSYELEHPTLAKVRKLEKAKMSMLLGDALENITVEEA